MAVSDKTKLRKVKEAMARAGVTLDENGDLVLPSNDDDEEDDSSQDSEHEEVDDDDDGDNEDLQVDDVSDDGDALMPPAKLPKASKQRNQRVLPSAATRRTSKSLAIEQLEAAETVQATKEQKVDPMELLIWNAVKDELYRNCKFANGPAQRRAVTMKCLEKMNLEEFKGDSEAIKALKLRWCKVNEGMVIKKLNKLRNYTGTQTRNAAFAYMKEHQGKLPSRERLEQILKRDLDMTKDDDYEDFKWWVDEVMPLACGNQTLWNKDKRRYLCMSTAAPPNNPTSKHITPATEAMAVCFFENFRSKWEALYKLKSDSRLAACTTFQTKHKTLYASDGRTLAYDWEIDPKNKKVCNLNGPRWMGKCTFTDLGPGKDSGWNKEGRQLFNTLKEMNKTARATAKCLEVEEAFLHLFKDENGILGATAAEERARKRRKTKQIVQDDPDDEVEMVHDSE